MKNIFKGVSLTLIAFILSTNCNAKDVEILELRINEAKYIFQEMRDMPDTAIPRDLMEKCAGVAIFPSVLKAGFGIGGQYGQGVLLNRNTQTGQWSAPVFVSIGGASIGFQIGGQATDMILIVGNERGMDSLSHSNVTLGGDVSVAAGPLGREASADTDALLRAGILSYSRSKGLFAGVSLKGCVVGPMKNLNNEYYGEGVTAADILFNNKIMPTKTGQELISVLENY